MKNKFLDISVLMICRLEEMLMRLIDWFKLSNTPIKTERSVLLHGDLVNQPWSLPMTVIKLKLIGKTFTKINDLNKII